MIVTAWNNGEHHSTGAAYGFKLDAKDRDRYFRKVWKNVFLELEDQEEGAVVHVDKSSFWNTTCRELISKKIGIWLIENGKVPWSKGHPPKLKMEHIDDNRFKVKFI